MLIEDAAFHKLSEMSNIGPWIDGKGKLQWDYVKAAGFEGARSVRNGNARKAQLVESGGYTFNDKGKLCIQGYWELGNLGGAATKAAHIEREGHMINEHGKQCITGFHKLGGLGGAANARIHTAKALDEHHTHICISALCQRGVSVRWEMMMIAFITFKSSLVPLFEGYDVQIHGNLSCRGLDGIEPTT